MNNRNRGIGFYQNIRVCFVIIIHLNLLINAAFSNYNRKFCGSEISEREVRVVSDKAYSYPFLSFSRDSIANKRVLNVLESGGAIGLPDTGQVSFFESPALVAYTTMYSHLYAINKKLYGGFAINLQYYDRPLVGGTLASQYFLKTGSDVRPYLYCRVGYAIGISGFENNHSNGGLFADCGVGLQLRTNMSRSHFIGVGFRHQRHSMYTDQLPGQTDQDPNAAVWRYDEFNRAIIIFGVVF